MYSVPIGNIISSIYEISNNDLEDPGYLYTLDINS